MLVGVRTWIFEDLELSLRTGGSEIAFHQGVGS